MPTPFFSDFARHIGTLGLAVTIAATVDWSLAAIATRLLRRGSAAIRHQIWAIAALAVVVSPLALPALRGVLPDLPSPRGPSPTPDSIPGEPVVAAFPESPSRREDLRVELLISPVAESPRPSPARNVLQPVASGSHDTPRSFVAMVPWNGILVGIWLAGLALEAVIIVRTVACLRAILVRAAPLTTDSVHERFESVRIRCGLSRRIGLRQTDEVAVPFVAGLFRPCVVLPAEWKTWSDARLDAVFTHELMHVRRHDVVWQALARVAAAFVWFHPFGWFALRRLRAEAECATDDAVLGTGQSPFDYAEHLLSIARQVLSQPRTSGLAIFMASRFPVEDRLRSILDPAADRRRPRRTQTCAIGIGAVIAAFVVAIVAPGRAQETTRQDKPATSSRERSVPTEGETPETTANARIHEILDSIVSIEIGREVTLHEALAEIAWTHRIPIRLDEFSLRMAGSSGQDLGRGLPETRGTLRSVLKLAVESFLPESRPSGMIPLQRVQDGMLGISLEQDAYEYLRKQPWAGQPPIVLIRGTVRRADGMPAQRAKLEAMGWSVSTFAVADEEGRFVLPVHAGLSSGMVLIARESDSQAAVVQIPTVDLRKTPPVVSLALRRTVDGELTAVDAKGKPVAEADVAVTVLGGRFLRKKTDAAGRLRLSLPPELPLDSIVVWKGGAGLDYHEYRTLPGGPTIKRRDFGSIAKELSFVLTGAKSATLVLTDNHDRPLSGIRVYPFVLHKKEEIDSLNLTEVNQFGQVTNSAGEATFDWLPTWSFGSVQFLHTSTGYARQPMLITSADPNGMRKNFRLIPRARISGHVRTPEGEPVAGAEVVGGSAGYDDNGRIDAVKTGQDGGYSLAVDPDQLCLLLAQSADGRFVSPARDDIVTFAGADLTGVDLVLEPATKITGTSAIPSGVADEELGSVMLDQYGREIRSIPGVDLSNPNQRQQSVTPQWTRYGRIGPDGRFEFRVAPGRYRIRGPEQAMLVGGDGWITVAGQADVEVKLSIPPTSAVLTGLVVAGDPAQVVPQARVKAIDETLDLGFPNMLADDAGKFPLKKARSRMFIQAYSPDRKLGGILEVGPERDSATIELVPTARVRLRLLDPDGQPFARKGLVAARFEVFGNVTWNPDPSVPIGRDGAVEFPDLIVGAQYVIEISTDDGQMYRFLTKPRPIEAGPVDLGDVTVKPENRPHP